MTGNSPDANGLYSLTVEFWHNGSGTIEIATENQIRDLTLACDPCPQVIPTLGEWGLIILSLLLLIIGVIAVQWSAELCPVVE